MAGLLVSGAGCLVFALSIMNYAGEHIDDQTDMRVRVNTFPLLAGLILCALVGMFCWQILNDED